MISLSGLVHAGFNSATALRPWRTTLVKSGNLAPLCQLQFGHGAEAVENYGLFGALQDTSIRLQFGHGAEAVENISDHPWTWENKVRFNSATALRPWRTVGPAGPTRFPVLRFNSATALRPWRTLLKCLDLLLVGQASIRPRR